jgi:polyphosphate kinase 2
MVDGASPDELKSLRRMLFEKAEAPRPGIDPDLELAPGWRDGGYPYKNLMSRRSYEKQKYRLQVELLKLQAWVKETGQRVVILFEGRDAAGKGGTIKRFMEHLNPRGARVVALEKPSDVERGQWYFQRYIEHLPTRGEIVMFDRSWYNRAGVERVMGFCSHAEYDEFMRQCPEFERHLVRSGVHLFKFWFSVSRAEQRRRFKERKAAPAQAVEAVAHRHGQPGQMGRLHARQGSHVPAHRHQRFAVDGDQERLQEARAAERHALPAARLPYTNKDAGRAGHGRPAAGGPAPRWWPGLPKNSCRPATS